MVERGGDALVVADRHDPVAACIGQCLLHRMRHVQAEPVPVFGMLCVLDDFLERLEVVQAHRKIARGDAADQADFPGRVSSS